MRAVTAATLVCKRGTSAVVFDDEIGNSLDDGQTGPGFAIEVFNVLGAGDGFMSGLLKAGLTRKTAHNIEICKCLRCFCC